MDRVAALEGLQSGAWIDRIRCDFPILSQTMRGQPLAYLDNAATTQKPQCVIDVITSFYREHYASVHRGVYQLSEQATIHYEGVRERVQQFLNAPDPNHIVFVRGTTEAINLVAHSFGQAHLQSGDEVVITAMEHHANIVPWQILCEKQGAILRVVPINEVGDIDLDAYRACLNEKTRLVAMIHVSNVLGTVNPVQKMTQWAHQVGAVVLVDGAQAVAHFRVDVQAMDCDFYAFSAHKMYGPTGIGVLYGKASLLDDMPPYQSGGAMIERVTYEHSDYAVSPRRFEAGTPHIAGAWGLECAIDYLDRLGWPIIEAYEQKLCNFLLEVLDALPGVRILGSPEERVGNISCVLEGIHAHDVATVLDCEGIAVRAGHHCAMPLMNHYRVPATVRISLGLYNTEDEINRLCAGLLKAKRILQ